MDRGDGTFLIREAAAAAAAGAAAAAAAAAEDGVKHLSALSLWR